MRQVGLALIMAGFLCMAIASAKDGAYGHAAAALMLGFVNYLLF